MPHHAGGATVTTSPDSAPRRPARPRWRRAAALGGAALTGAAVFGVTGATVTTPAAAPNRSPITAPGPALRAGTGYEYIWASAQPNGNIAQLTDLGADGWEVVAPISQANGGYWIFLLRRPLA
ncbi:hypothetical protein SSCG_02100 [Streptomyces clavuligerus]|nr:hypothetical protein SSCG_02100 [Streptomyces clavuligerus]